jgi:hypothetical protein
MGPEGAVNIVFRKELEEADDAGTRRAELIEQYKEQFANPYVAAERGYVDDVIEPRRTRPVLIEALKAADHEARAPPTAQAREHPALAEPVEGVCPEGKCGDRLRRPGAGDRRFIVGRDGHVALVGGPRDGGRARTAGRLIGSPPRLSITYSRSGSTRECEVPDRGRAQIFDRGLRCGARNVSTPPCAKTAAALSPGFCRIATKLVSPNQLTCANLHSRRSSTPAARRASVSWGREKKMKGRRRRRRSRCCRRGPR